MPAILPDWVWTPSGLRTGCSVETDADLIVGVGAPTRHNPVRRLPHTLLLPGLVNAHSHAFQRVFRGRVQGGRGDFWTWRHLMYQAARSLPPEGVAAISRLAFLEMAEAGVTEVGEFHYLHHQPDGTPYDDPDELARRVIGAAREVGIRITLLRVVYGRSAPGEVLGVEQLRFGDRDATDALRSVARLAASLDHGVRVGLAPHSVRAVPPEWLPELTSVVGPIHSHVSEQPRDNERCVAETGRSPVSLLADAGLLTERFCAVHLTHPMEGDVERMRVAGARVCVCPSTELDLGDGFYPLASRGLPMCVGSDSQAVIDVFAEARTLELHGRALAGRRGVLPGEELAESILQAATVVGSQALGAAGQGIVVGAPADFVLLDLDRVAADGVPPLQAAAFVATPDWVREVWVAGAPIVVDGCHPQREVFRAEAAAWL